MKRRQFVTLCASAVAGVSASPELLSEGVRKLQNYERVKLIDQETQEPIRASSLKVGETYVFHYPYVTTPCFLIDLGRPVESRGSLLTRNKESYRWPGGSGPNRSVVSFSAICAHKMSHPAPSVSFINYRHGKICYRNHDDEIVEGRDIIYCCSEKSVYDPSRGARVLGGPAPQPLAAIALDYEAEEDSFYATATIGGEMFDRYFIAFSDRLTLDHLGTDIHRVASGTTKLIRLKDFTKNQVLC
jgi:Rieske Fe-S protein